LAVAEKSIVKSLYSKPGRFFFLASSADRTVVHSAQGFRWRSRASFTPVERSGGFAAVRGDAAAAAAAAGDAASLAERRGSTTATS
jgi:hypothetical protein